MTTAPSACHACGAHAVTVHPVRHHFICAYVGPSYDFLPHQEGDLCPKCNRLLSETGQDWEILGDSSLCMTCGDERMLYQPRGGGTADDGNDRVK